MVITVDSHLKGSRARTMAALYTKEQWSVIRIHLIRKREMLLKEKSVPKRMVAAPLGLLTDNLNPLAILKADVDPEHTQGKKVLAVALSASIQ